MEYNFHYAKAEFSHIVSLKYSTRNGCILKSVWFQLDLKPIRLQESVISVKIFHRKVKWERGFMFDSP